jgi:hypothetical protein
MIATQNYGAHSAKVKMTLVIDATTLDITHMGPNYVYLASLVNHPPCEGTIIMEVDDSRREWKVALPHGISKDTERVIVGLPNS